MSNASTTRIIAPHVDILRRSGISEEQAMERGIFSVVTDDGLDKTTLSHFGGRGLTGLVFPLTEADGTTSYQMRLDDRHVTPDQGKYLQESGRGAILTVPKERQKLVGKATKIVIVEGTKQTIAADLYLPDEWLVIGIQGCHNFSKAGIPLPEIGELVPEGAEPVILFDADWQTNFNVWSAAKDLQSHLEIAIGTQKPKIATIPGGSKLGLDDLLGAVPVVEKRQETLLRIIEAATPALGRKPKKPTTSKNANAGPSELKVNMDDGVILRTSSSDDGAEQYEVALAAAARIVEAEAHIDPDDGEASSQVLKLEVTVKIQEGEETILRHVFVRVPSSSLSNLGHWLDRLPNGIGVSIPRSTKPDDDVANAIRQQSVNIVNIAVVPHTGWTFDIEDETWRWCDGNGAIGMEDKVTRLRGEPASRDFQAINLPIAYDKDRKSKVQLLKFIRDFVMARELFNEGKMFSWDVGVAGWGLSFLGVVPNAAVCWFGPPSSGKSTIAQTIASSLNPGWSPKTGAAMATFNARPAGMDLLPNGLQHCFLHVDDLKPESDKASMSAALKAFDALLRRAHGSGGAVRGEVNRASDSLGVRKVDGAAPFMFITGEEIPSGEGFAQSGLDRALFIAVEPKTQLKSADTLAELEAMGRSGNLRYVTAAYLQWIAEQVNSIGEDEDDELGFVEPSSRFDAWKVQVDGIRNDLYSKGSSGKIFPDDVRVSDRASLLAASLVTGYSSVLDFATEMGAISEDEANGLHEDFTVNLREQVLKHTNSVMGGNLTRSDQALAQLRNAVSSRQVSIDPADENNSRPLVGRETTLPEEGPVMIINHAAAAKAIGYPGGGLALSSALSDIALVDKKGAKTRTLTIGGARVQTCVIPLDTWKAIQEGDEEEVVEPAPEF